MTKRVNYRKLAFAHYDPLCAHCGFGIPAVLEVAHLDGNRSNNELPNLVILCPNCHKMHDLDLISTVTIVEMRDRPKVVRWAKRMKDAGQKAALKRLRRAAARKAADTRKRKAAISIRPYRPDDAAALLALFKDTIRRVNSRDYNPEQIAAWAPDDYDFNRWTSRFAGRFVVVAEEDGRPVGFAELEADGHIDRVYVSADHVGKGVGKLLLAAVLAEAEQRGLTRLFVEASITARPFFEAVGFAVIAEQTVTVRGVEFVNYRMERVG